MDLYGFEATDVENLLRMVKRRANSFGWDSAEAAKVVTEMLPKFSEAGWSFQDAQSGVLETFEQVYEDYQAEELDEVG